MLFISSIRLLALLNICCIPLLAHAMDPNEQFAMAVEAEYLYEMQAALKAGADINFRFPNGMTALIFATSLGNTGMVQLLLNNGADTTVTAKYGSTALDIARKEFRFFTTSQTKKQIYKEIGRMLLKAYIKQLKKAGMNNAESRAVLESKKAELRETIQGLPTDVIKYTEKFLKP